MSLKILMVDGYDYNGWKSLNNAKCIDAFEHYSNTLKSISSNPIEIFIIHPGKQEEYIPLNVSIKDFDGIVWTGSSLNIYDYTPSITRQIELAKETLKHKSNIFGSCWGMQVYVEAAGGNVRKSLNGREIIFARNIQLSETGKNHEMYKNKTEKFDAFCSHIDEIATVPNNCEILSTNEHSKVQSLSFKLNGAEFWGTQYHPEFDFDIMSKIISARKSLLISENLFEDENHANQVILNLKNNNSNFLKIGNDILNKKIRNKEIENWLNYISRNK